MMNGTDGVEWLTYNNYSGQTVYLYFGGAYHALSSSYCDGDAGGVLTYVNNWNAGWTPAAGTIRCYKAGVDFSSVTANDIYVKN